MNIKKIKKINILSKIYTIEYVNTTMIIADHGYQCHGNIDFLEKHIRVCIGRQYADNLQTFIHEILHAIIREHNIMELEVHEDAERIVDTLAAGITDTLIRNKFIKEGE